jgi:AcrR family transcriptional regulator
MEARADAARTALLDAAERLFAERGIEAVSLRDVCTAAGQRNHSAAQYHFGDRRGVVAAVFERRMRVVSERRHAMLDRVEANGASSSMADIVAAIVIPLTDVVAESNAWYGRFVARTQWDTFAAEVVADLPAGASYRRALAMVVAAADIPSQLRRSRLEQVGTLLIGTVAGWEWQGQRDGRRLALDDLQSELIATLTALITVSTTRSTS